MYYIGGPSDGHVESGLRYVVFEICVRRDRQTYKPTVSSLEVEKLVHRIQLLCCSPFIAVSVKQLSRVRLSVPYF